MRTLVAFLLLSRLQLAAQDMQSCPMHKEHMKEASQHQADVEKHGDEAMGFPHGKTTHHFRLYSDGGAIQVTVNDSKDSQNMQAIRSHLAHIASMFSNGEFSIPMFVHENAALPRSADKQVTRSANGTLLQLRHKLCPRRAWSATPWAGSCGRSSEQLRGSSCRVFQGWRSRRRLRWPCRATPSHRYPTLRD